MSFDNLTHTNERLARLRQEWQKGQSRARPTRKHGDVFRAVKPEPGPLSSLLKRVIKNTPVLSSSSLGLLTDAWAAITGAEISDATRIVSYNRGILTVGVISNSLLQELESFYKRELLETLRQDTEIDVRQLKFIKTEEI